MKKGTEGYVLIYVLVVFILLGLACATVCTFALNGLKTQRAALENDRQRYAAEGLVEQVSALLMDDAAGIAKITTEWCDDSDLAETELENSGKAMIESLDAPATGRSASVKKIEWVHEEGTCSFITGIQAISETQQIDATLRVTLTVSLCEDSKPVVDGEGNPVLDDDGNQVYETDYRYQVTSASMSYDSYQIQTLDPEGGE